MGGANAGEIASGLAVNIISEQTLKKYSETADSDDLKGILLSAITAANIEIFSKASSSSELNGMGTTVVAALASGRTAVIAHAGDSRAYITDNGEIKAVTKDHSLVEEMVDRGLITPEEAENHPDKNLITRALGVQSYIDVDFNVFEIPTGETVLLCSDGLTNFVSDGIINKIIASEKCEDIAKKLIEAANENGGGDNITAIAFRIDEEIQNNG